MSITANNFRFSKIMMFKKMPEFEPNQMVIKPLKADKTFGVLSPMIHKVNVKHHIPQIRNEAPTLEQYWQELKVFPNEVDSNGSPNMRLNPSDCSEPNTQFFEAVNNNFKSAANVRRRKQRGAPLYWYHIDEHGNVEHLGYLEARKYYCKVYEQTTMVGKAKTTFEKLRNDILNRTDKNVPVIIRGHDIVNNLETETDIVERYHDGSKPFGHEYCLVEMLIHYPNMNECIWNVEDA